jgi:histidinol phosphatase-like PHP family hydrolase
MKRFINSMALVGLILISCNSNYPKIDLHVHHNRSVRLPGNSANDAYKKESELSKQTGVIFGIAEEFDDSDKRINDSLLLDRIALAKKNSFYIGIQVSQRDWPNVYSKEVLDQLDYILADALIFPNKEGIIMQIWNGGQPIGEPQEFMDLYVAHNLEVLSEPITIWANPTFLPIELSSRYDELWTDARMKRLIDEAVKNNIAIEINSRFKVPNERFIKMAKASGAHFTFGSNSHDKGAGDIYWSINMAKKCRLKKGDFFTPRRQLSFN